MSHDEKHLPSDDSNDELDSTVNNEKVSLLSSRESSPAPSDNATTEDPRFARPSPSPFKRLALVVFLGFLFWAAFQMRSALLEDKRHPKVIHASRYSKEYKFRPAASPVVTETLRDGRVRVRGAHPTPTELPTPPKKQASTGKLSGKKRNRKSNPKKAVGTGRTA